MFIFMLTFLFSDTYNHDKTELGAINKHCQMEKHRNQEAIVRYPHTQKEVDILFKRKRPTAPTIKQRMRTKCACSLKDMGQYFLSMLPIISVLRSYKREFILGDVLSGVSAACLHFPQGLAFGLLASLAPSYGLYTSFFPVILYIIFGTSPHLSIGTNAVIALFTSDLVRENVIHPTMTTMFNSSSNSSIDTDITDKMYLVEKASLAAGATFLVGAILLVLGLLRLGSVTSYLSSSFISGFTAAAAVNIITSQIPKAIGVRIPPIKGPGKLVLIYIEIFKRIHTANVCSVGTSIISLIILVVVKDIINERYKERMKMPVPIDLILVIVATVISYFANLHSEFGLVVVGEIPVGVPAPEFPTLKSSIIGDAVIISVVIFVLNVAMVRLCEVKHNYQVCDNQELVAYGTTNLISSFFLCFPSCTAPPRTVVLSTMGSRTTLNGLFTSCILLLTLLVLGQYFSSLPVPVLSIMVIVAVKNLLAQVRVLPNFWRINKYDLCIWLATFLSGVFIEFPYAIYVGVLMCLLTAVIQSQRGKSYVMEKAKCEELYLDSSAYEGLINEPNFVIFRMESSLYFATAQRFRSKLYEVTGNPRKTPTTTRVVEESAEEQAENGIKYVSKDNPVENGLTNDHGSTAVTHVIIDCSSVNYIDMNGINILMQIISEYEKAGVTLLVARCTRYMLDIIEKSPLAQKLTDNCIFPDISDAAYNTK